MLHKIENFLTPLVLSAIAREYTVKGRLLFVATTDLDEPVGVMWNMGAIAASGHPQSATLFAKILLASASIPGAFPPVMIDIDHGDEHYQEMHVDGGTVAQVALYPPSLSGEDLSKAMAGSDRTELEVIATRKRRL